MGVVLQTRQWVSGSLKASVEVIGQGPGSWQLRHYPTPPVPTDLGSFHQGGSRPLPWSRPQTITRVRTSGKGWPPGTTAGARGE